MKFEHHVEPFDEHYVNNIYEFAIESQHMLNKLSAEGWELVSVRKEQDGSLFFFKRPVPS